MRELRWKCDEKGCYRQLMPRLGVLDECFPGKIGMSDIDGIVEIRGYFLILEWKAPGGALTTGQRIMFERMTGLSGRLTIIVVCGDPQTMAISSLQVFSGGKAGPVEEYSLERLKARVSAWAKRAGLHSRRAA